jgi:hypothetical protein
MVGIVTDRLLGLPTCASGVAAHLAAHVVVILDHVLTPFTIDRSFYLCHIGLLSPRHWSALAMRMMAKTVFAIAKAWPRTLPQLYAGTPTEVSVKFDCFCTILKHPFRGCPEGALVCRQIPSHRSYTARRGPMPA